jgi:hypothetical protein
MGYEIEILPDGKIRQSRIPGTPQLSFQELRKQAPLVMKLIQTVHGTRRSYETLAKSVGFDDLIRKQK